MRVAELEMFVNALVVDFAGSVAGEIAEVAVVTLLRARTGMQSAFTKALGRRMIPSYSGMQAGSHAVNQRFRCTRTLNV